MNYGALGAIALASIAATFVTFLLKIATSRFPLLQAVLWRTTIGFASVGAITTLLVVAGGFFGRFTEFNDVPPAPSFFSESKGEWETFLDEDRLTFSTPAEVISKYHQWFPEANRLRINPTITSSWPSEAVAFYLVWECWPEIAVWAPKQPPLVTPLAEVVSENHEIGRDWPEFRKCAGEKIRDRGKSLSERARSDALRGAFVALRQKLDTTLATATCRETGANDCVLLLMQWAEMFPKDQALATRLARIETLLKARPSLNHPHRQLALAKVKVALALAAMDHGAEPSFRDDSLRAKLEKWMPGVMAAFKLSRIPDPPQFAMAPEEIKHALLQALETELAERERRRQAPTHASYHELSPLWPILLVEDAPGKVRQEAMKLLVAEMARRATEPQCDQRMVSGNSSEGDLAYRDRFYGVFSQLSFVYAATRARTGDATRCWVADIPAISRDKEMLIDLKGLVDAMVGDETKPWANVVGERLLEQICGQTKNDDVCKKLPKGRLDINTIDSGSLFTLQKMKPGQSDFLEALPAQPAKAIAKVFADLRCNPEQSDVWTLPGAESVLVEADCYRDHLRNSDASDFWSQPLDDGRSRVLVAYRNGKASRLFAQNHFMYDDEGTLIAVTDADHDGRLELWFKGSDGECDGGGESCDPYGTSYGEDFGGVVARFRDKRMESVSAN